MSLPLPPEYNFVQKAVRHLPGLLDVFPQAAVPLESVAAAFGVRVLRFPTVHESIPLFVDQMTMTLLETIAFSIVARYLYRATAHAPHSVRLCVTLALVSALAIWPLVHTEEQAMALRFMRPAFSFRTSLLVWDVFQIRPREEVLTWDISTFLAYLWAFPVEGQGRDAAARRKGRIASVRQAGPAVLLGIVAAAMQFIVPPAAVVPTLSRAALHGYCLLMAINVYLLLYSTGTLLLCMLGVVIGVEQQPLFENPLTTTNIRVFWSRWNRPIATVLHRVIFGGEGTFKTMDQRKRGAEKQQKRAERGLDARFFKTSALAMVTFLVSGLFHEFLVCIGLQRTDLLGSNTLFFLANGAATVLASALPRVFPRTCARTPAAVPCACMWLFAYSALTLFFAPLLEADLFPRMQTMVLAALGRPTAAPYFVYLLGS